MIENSTTGAEIWPYLLGPNFGQHSAIETYNTCIVNSQILEYVIRVLMRVVHYALDTPMDLRSGKSLLHTQSRLCAPFGHFQVPPSGWKAPLHTRSWLCAPFDQFKVWV